MEYHISNQKKLINFLYVIYKRKYSFLAFFVVIYLAIIAGTWLAPQSYKATTKILIHTNPKQEISLFPDLSKPGERSFRVNIAQDMVQILTGEELVAEIVSEFELDKIYYKKNHKPESYRDITWFYVNKIVDFIKSPYNLTKRLLVYLGVLDHEPEENYFHSAMQEFMADWLDVLAENDSKVVNLAIWGPEPRLSSNIANRMAELLVIRTLEVTQNQASAGYESTISQLKNIKNRYLQSQEDLKKFREEKNIFSIQDQKRTLVSTLSQLETEKGEIEADLYGISNALNEIRAKLKKEEEKILSASLTGNNPILINMKSQVKDLEITLRSMMLKKTEKHPDIIQLKIKIKDMKNRLKKEAENIVYSETESINPIHQNLRQRLIEFETQKAYHTAKQESLEHNIFKIREEISSIPQKEFELEQLETLADIHSNLYSTVKDKLEKLLVLKANEVNEFGLSVITKAHLPDVMPVSWPWWDINTIYVGIPLSLLIALFGGFFIDYWTDTFRTKSEVEFNLELPVIGLIPDLKKKNPLKKITGYQTKMTGISVEKISTNKSLFLQSERRSNDRLAVNSPMTYQYPTTGEKYEAKLVNISEYGVGFELAEFIAPGTNINIEIEWEDIDGSKLALELPGKVSWSKCIDESEVKKRYNTGLQLITTEEDMKISEDSLLKFQEIIKKLNEKII